MPPNLALRKSAVKHLPLRVFKYRRRQFRVGRTLTIKETWTRMVKASCPCADCLCVGPDVDAANDGAATVDIRCDKTMDGALYRALFVPDECDNDGHIESWHWHMVPIDTPAVTGKPDA